MLTEPYFDKLPDPSVKPIGTIKDLRGVPFKDYCLASKMKNKVQTNLSLANLKIKLVGDVQRQE